ncbi:hypothetical protein GT204_07915 [Streptomyces sp. SID4919]|uniref:hypothetical protein n=1 Tax=unclassified Streptomyces TaxID=2593676 RepID=UPI000823C021|nr:MULTISPECIES: hypothetical protein [unclassified Streptomyces]MYY08831.1 hypothetical protein [Streptomyces sp. SID4919]SCK25628.1 hypothetical protein YW7DRAFT_01967 [Streptomyces sp. AmelKG-E11A]
MAFPEDPLGTRIELQIGGVWTDITGDVRLADIITHTRGRQDRAARADPATCSLRLNSEGGKYSPRNPRSPLFGLIGRNTPVRVSVPGYESYLLLGDGAATHAFTPDAPPLDIVGDLDVRAEVEADWYRTGPQILIAKWGSLTSQRSWMLRLESGMLYLVHSINGLSAGTHFQARPLPALPRRAALRVTLDVNAPAGTRTGAFYWAPTLDGPWEKFAPDVTLSGATSIHSGTAPLTVGLVDPTYAPSRYPLMARARRFEVRAGINGPIVASPDFTIQPAGTTAFTDASGRPWSLSGAAEITDRQTRFVGEYSDWPASWSPSGAVITVAGSASGILRRLGQGDKAIDSTLRRRVGSWGGLLAYWPMEEEAGAEQAYSPVSRVGPLSVPGAEWAADDTLAGSLPLPKVGRSLRGRIPAPRVWTQSWHVEMVYRLSALPPSESTLLEVVTASRVYPRLRITVSSLNLRLYGITPGDDSSSVTLLASYLATGVAGQWSRIQMYARQEGANFLVFVRWIPIGGAADGSDSHSFTITVSNAALGRVTQINTVYQGGSFAGTMPVGHLAVFDHDNPAAYNYADHGFLGESAGARIRRLADEEKLPVTVTSNAPSTAMGAQRPETLLGLLESCEAADGGILIEDRETLALRYRSREAMYSQDPALTLSYGDLAPPLEPVDDDQAVRNDITVSRAGGSAARAVLEDGPLSVQAPPAGVGRYDESVELNVHTDDQTEPIAFWRLHLGTWDEARYPVVRLRLHRTPHLIRDVLAVSEGDLIRITDLPDWLPPGPLDLLVEGYTERIGVRTWEVDLVCSPAGPWQVGTADHPVTGRVDTDGSRLATAATATATTLSVAVTDGPLWVTSAAKPAEFPFDVRIAGEVVTVLAVTGTASPQTWTVQRSANGIVKTLPAGADVRLATPSFTAL